MTSLTVGQCGSRRLVCRLCFLSASAWRKDSILTDVCAHTSLLSVAHTCASSNFLLGEWSVGGEYVYLNPCFLTTSCLLAVSERLTVLVLSPLHQYCKETWINSPDSLFLSPCNRTEELQTNTSSNRVISSSSSRSSSSDISY